MSSQPQSTSETPMSDSMSDTSGVHENSKWDPPDEELEPDSQHVSSLSSSSKLSISSSLSSWSGPDWQVWDPPRRSVRQSRSARLEPDPSISTEQSLTSCLHLTLFTTMLLLFQTDCFGSNPTEADDPFDPLTTDPGGGIVSKNSVTTSGSVCRMTLGCGRTTIEVNSGKIWAEKIKIHTSKNYISLLSLPTVSTFLRIKATDLFRERDQHVLHSCQ